MKIEQEQKKRAGKTIRYLHLILVLLVLLTVATYTWFSLSRTPKVSEMGLSVDSGEGLELAFDIDSDEWTQYLDFREKMSDTMSLKPVTWSEKNKSFYTAVFGTDGRIASIGAKLEDQGGNSSKATQNDYYMKQTCYARTQEKVTVSLSPAVASEDGRQGAGTYVIGTPLWDKEQVQHNNGGNGAENTIRVGIRVTKYDKSDKTPTGDTVFYIYEPNCDTHLDGSVTDQATPSIDGTDTLVPTERLIRQSASTWTEADPVQKNVVIRSLGEFTTATELFTLDSREVAQIDFYVWMEGQDVDCNNEIGTDAQIFVNVQFAATTDSQTGLEPIR